MSLEIILALSVPVIIGLVALFLIIKDKYKK